MIGRRHSEKFAKYSHSGFFLMEFVAICKFGSFLKQNNPEANQVYQMALNEMNEYIFFP